MEHPRGERRGETREPRRGLGRRHDHASGGISGIRSEITALIYQYFFFAGILMKTLVDGRRPISGLHSQPRTLPGYLLGCYTSWGFPPLFFSLPFPLCFCKLNYLNALFGSPKSRRFTLFPPRLPFLSLLFALVFSGSFAALFQWHLLKFAQKKIFLQ